MSPEFEIVRAVQGVFVTSSIGVSLAMFMARWLVYGFAFLAVWMGTSRSARERHAVAEAGWSAGLAMIFVLLAGSFIQRVRPYLAVIDEPDALAILIPEPLNTSFPSGHTAISFAVAAALFAGNRRIGTLAFALAVAVAFGRMAVGVHYPSDLFGGALVGVAAFGIVRFFHRQLRTRDVEDAAKRHRH